METSLPIVWQRFSLFATFRFQFGIVSSKRNGRNNKKLLENGSLSCRSIIVVFHVSIFRSIFDVQVNDPRGSECKHLLNRAIAKH